MELVIIISILLVGLICGLIGLKLGKRNGLNQQIELNQLSNDEVLKERKILQTEIAQQQDKIRIITAEYESKKQLIANAKEAAEKEYAERKDNLNNQYSFEYKELQRKFQEQESILQKQFEEDKSIAEEEIAAIKVELDKIRRQKAAVIEAKQREEALKEQVDAYRLDVTKDDLKDINLLRSIQFKLNNPRPISMVIWQSFYQPIAKKKFPIILGQKDISGIYKISNIITEKCYIGQAKDIYKRFNEHCRCGLGIDTPQNNKLYQAMLEDGLENFTFELLEACSSEELNNKEKYYIELYNSIQYGYNSQSGVKENIVG